jgi:hypothetical protein
LFLFMPKHLCLCFHDILKLNLYLNFSKS